MIRREENGAVDEDGLGASNTCPVKSKVFLMCSLQHRSCSHTFLSIRSLDDPSLCCGEDHETSVAPRRGE